MMVARSSAERVGLAEMGGWEAITPSQVGLAGLGAVGKQMRHTPGGKPEFAISLSSVGPRKQALDSLCSRMCRTVCALSEGYTGTLTCPAIQIARSAITHQAEFRDRMATRDPGSQSCA